jgi:25S rRNA (uracil2634-N3)-methyltransferase
LNIFLNFKENQMGECSVDNNGAEKWIEHYSSSHKILVGEGDFSFASCLAKAFGTAANMIATSFHSKGISRVSLSLPSLSQIGIHSNYLLKLLAT